MMDRWDENAVADSILSGLNGIRGVPQWARDMTAEGINLSLGDAEFALPVICETPGERIRSKGQGRGLARGGGYGPLGVPLGAKSEYSKWMTAEGIEASLGATAFQDFLKFLTPDPELVRAATPLLQTLLATKGSSASTQNATLQTLLLQARTPEEKQALLDAYTKMQEGDDVWTKIKWPVYIGLSIGGIGLLVFLFKRKEFAWGHEGMSLRA